MHARCRYSPLVELYNNQNARLTRWISEQRCIGEFRILDVGAALGLSPRWNQLGDLLNVIGFDAIQEAIAPLEARKRPGDKYFSMALGNEDGQREFFIPAEKTAGSIYAPSVSRYDVAESTYRGSETRTVPIRRLDSLFAAGEIGPVDFIKLDCEGFEPEVLKGAGRYLAACDLVGADLETNFNVSPVLPQTHFWGSYEPLLQRGLLVHDLRFNRVALASYIDRVKRKRFGWRQINSVHRPATVNILLARSLLAEERKPGIDLIIKQIIVFELYGLIDCAYDLLIGFADILTSRLDVKQAADLLVPPTMLARVFGEAGRRSGTVTSPI